MSSQPSPQIQCAIPNRDHGRDQGPCGRDATNLISQNGGAWVSACLQHASYLTSRGRAEAWSLTDATDAALEVQIQTAKGLAQAELRHLEGRAKRADFLAAEQARRAAASEEELRVSAVEVARLRGALEAQREAARAHRCPTIWQRLRGVK